LLFIHKSAKDFFNQRDNTAPPRSMKKFFPWYYYAVTGISSMIGAFVALDPEFKKKAAELQQQQQNPKQ
jgi:hypothetical protein